MEKKSEFDIQVLKLDKPLYVVGCSVRVKHGTPECFPTIAALILKFFTDDMPSKIANKKEPLIRFGICSDHVYYDDIIEFTYLAGVQVQKVESQLPEKTETFIVPEGEYACIKVSAPDAQTAIGIAYINLDKWINESSEWESIIGEYEVYPNKFSDAEMELWRPIKRKA